MCMSIKLWKCMILICLWMFHRLHTLNPSTRDLSMMRHSVNYCQDIFRPHVLFSWQVVVFSCKADVSYKYYIYRMCVRYFWHCVYLRGSHFSKMLTSHSVAWFPSWSEFISYFIWLVVWNSFYDFPYIGNVIIPTDELIFFRGVGIPPTNYPSCISTWVVSYHLRHHICVNTVGCQAPTGWSSTRWHPQAGTTTIGSEEEQGG